jgi:hypothetical protein
MCTFWKRAIPSDSFASRDFSHPVRFVKGIGFNQVVGKVDSDLPGGFLLTLYLA